MAFFMLFVAPWLLESAAILLSIACQCIIISILFYMQDQPLSKWTLKVSLPATISILITTSKSMLLLVVAACISQCKWDYFRTPRRLRDFDEFDQASRGPLGALMLLKRKSFYTNVAIIGAFITLSSLALDPTAQLVIELQSRAIPADNATATFTMSSVYDSGAHFGAAGPHTVFTQDNMMTGAIINGLFGIPLKAPFDCHTANCTWPGKYTTLGFESKCANVTEQSKRKCNNDVDGIDKLNGKTKGPQICNITTPGGVVLQSRYLPSEQRTALNVSALCTGMEFYEDYSDVPVLTCTPFLNTSTLTTFAVYKYSATDETNFDQVAPWEATECTIDLVKHTYSNVSVRANEFHIGETKTEPLYSRVPAQYANPNFTSTNFIDFTTEEDGGGETFKIMNADYYFLAKSLFSKIFRGGVTSGVVQFISNPEGVGPTAFVDANITELAQNVALSMTNRLRTTRNSTTATGVALTSVVYVNVNWSWFSVPICTVLAALCFLIITWVISSKRGTATWKSSSVALLMHGLDGMNEADRRTINDSRALREYARSAKVMASGSGTLSVERIGANTEMLGGSMAGKRGYTQI